MTFYFWLVIAATMIYTLVSQIYYALVTYHYFSSLYILLHITVLPLVNVPYKM
jgi:hypothetical protein